MDCHFNERLGLISPANTSCIMVSVASDAPMTKDPSNQSAAEARVCLHLLGKQEATFTDTAISLIW